MIVVIFCVGRGVVILTGFDGFCVVSVFSTVWNVESFIDCVVVSTGVVVVILVTLVECGEVVLYSTVVHFSKFPCVCSCANIAVVLKVEDSGFVIEDKVIPVPVLVTFGIVVTNEELALDTLTALDVLELLNCGKLVVMYVLPVERPETLTEVCPPEEVDILTVGFRELDGTFPVVENCDVVDAEEAITSFNVVETFSVVLDSLKGGCRSGIIAVSMTLSISCNGST